MAEINRNDDFASLPEITKPEGAPVTGKTYVVNVAPQTKLYRITDTSIQVLGFMSLLVWFLLLLTLLGISLSVLNNLNSVNTMKSQLQTAPSDNSIIIE